MGQVPADPLAGKRLWGFWGRGHEGRNYKDGVLQVIRENPGVNKTLERTFEGLPCWWGFLERREMRST